MFDDPLILLISIRHLRGLWRIICRSMTEDAEKLGIFVGLTFFGEIEADLAIFL